MQKLQKNPHNNMSIQLPRINQHDSKTKETKEIKEDNFFFKIKKPSK